MGKNFGKLLLQAAEQQQITQRELAAAIGVTEVRLFRLIHGDREPDAVEIYKLSRVLGVHPRHLKKIVNEERYGKMTNIGILLEDLVRVLEPRTFVRIRRMDPADRKLKTVFDGEAGDIRIEDDLEGYVSAPARRIMSVSLVPDPDTVDSVMEIVLAGK